MPHYRELNFDIAGEKEVQPASVNPDMLVQELIMEIGREFEINPVEEFELYHKESRQALEKGESVAVATYPGETLVFDRPATRLRQPIHSNHRASLQLQDNKEIYEVQWQPAIIGRPDADPVHSALLAIKLDFLDNSRRISRRHAQITEEDGTYYLELLAEKNPTFLNQEAMKVGQKYPLKPGDRILLKNSGVVLDFLLD